MPECNKPIQNRLGTEFDESVSSLHLLILRAHCWSNYICSKTKETQKWHVQHLDLAVSMKKTVWRETPPFIKHARHNTVDSCSLRTAVPMHRLPANRRCLRPAMMSVFMCVPVHVDASQKYNTSPKRRAICVVPRFLAGLVSTLFECQIRDQNKLNKDEDSIVRCIILNLARLPPP